MTLRCYLKCMRILNSSLHCGHLYNSFLSLTFLHFEIFFLGGLSQRKNLSNFFLSSAAGKFMSGSTKCTFGLILNSEIIDARFSSFSNLTQSWSLTFYKIRCKSSFFYNYSNNLISLLNPSTNYSSKLSNIPLIQYIICYFIIWIFFDDYLNILCIYFMTS